MREPHHDNGDALTGTVVRETAHTRPHMPVVVRRSQRGEYRLLHGGSRPRQIAPPKQYPLLPEGSSNPSEESAMEAGTAEQAAAGSTVPEHVPRPSTAPAPAGGTIADLLPHAVASFGEQVAIRHKQDGAWLDVTYAELGEIVRELALGLIDLGIQPGERVCILAG